MYTLPTARLAIALGLAISICSARAEDGFTRGLDLYKKKSYAESLQVLSSALCEGDKNAQRLYFSALCCLQLGNSKKAKDFFQEISKNYPATEAARLAQQYLKSGIGPSQSNGFAKNANSNKHRVEAEPEEFSVPFHKTAKGQIAVNADLQGRQLSMIFDTGAEECLFGKNQIAAANLSSAERSKSATLHSVAGPMTIFQVMAEIKLGALMKRIPVSVHDFDMDSAILGQPFFKGYSCSFDNQAGLIRFRRASAKTSAAPFDSFAIPFTEAGDKIIVTAKLNGLNTEMCFDTGAFGVCLSKKQCEKFGLKVPEFPSSQTRGPNGNRVPSWEMHADLSLGPIYKRSCAIRVVEADTSYPLLGQTFFGDRLFSIDRGRKEIRFAR